MNPVALGIQTLLIATVLLIITSGYLSELNEIQEVMESKKFLTYF